MLLALFHFPSAFNSSAVLASCLRSLFISDRIETNLFVKQEGFCFGFILIFPTVEEQHAVHDFSIRPDNRLDIVVAPASVGFAIGRQVADFFPAVTFIL